MDAAVRSGDEKAIRSAGIAAGRTALSAETQEALSHELDGYFALLEPTPRSVVRFLNAYTIRRLGTPPGGVTRPDVDALARWTIVELRWPEVAERLEAEPGLLDRWHRDGVDPDDPHHDLVRSREFTRVVLDGNEPALSSDDVRRCLGIPPP